VPLQPEDCCNGARADSIAGALFPKSRCLFSKSRATPRTICGATRGVFLRESTRLRRGPARSPPEGDNDVGGLGWFYKIVGTT
jgi:hypothetical protein